MPAAHPQPPDSSPIAFIGGGNMARSLVGGLVAGGRDPDTIHVADPVASAREALSADLGVRVFATAAEAVEGAGTWVFAVKPQVMREVCLGLADAARTARPLVVSIAAGITGAQLERWLGGETAVVRTMPNTPALLGAGVTGLHANPRVDSAGRAAAERLLASAGTTVWIEDEALMDAVTGVSGSGPAYVFLLAEAMEDAALAEGLPPAAARTLALQTILGAARMLTESGEAPAELRRRVTSPGGTTQAAIEVLETGGLRTLVAQAIRAATRRGGELSQAHD
ncbi:pyrroline-5-carboxylate reductase [Luteimonas kalidii]|uniref:Pyrroline-5-carboxylate reductase n=1 Tax=Luteimonas kalidii TaxID=3042025 RepID=A0ABT6JVJ9_9GAMM|nr:pyrroline-5-carboxylate reductase [Luteimonas kalidii]MDH5834697.1 pyrroline-5-carboxylate reductase [Luteimonas kalidii]